jgi:predicted RNase H-like HicB family nuclease
MMQEALEFHIQGLMENGVPIPVPSTFIDSVEVCQDAA